MKKLWYLLMLFALISVCFGQGQAPPTGNVPTVAWAASDPNGFFAYTTVDGSGNLQVTGGSGHLFQLGGYIGPVAPVAQDASGNWHYLLVDSSGNLKTTGSGGGGCANSITFNNTGSGAASGATFNCSAAVTISYNTIGAPSLSAANTWSALQTFGANISISGATISGGTAAAGTVLNATSSSVAGWRQAVTLGQASTLTGSLGLCNAGGSGCATITAAVGSIAAAVTLPDVADTLAMLAATQAFTNKTYNGLTITSSTGTLTIGAGVTLTANTTGTLGTGAFGGIAANSGTAGAIANYAAAGGSVAIAPDTTLTDNGTNLTYSGTGSLILPVVSPNIQATGSGATTGFSLATTSAGFLSANVLAGAFVGSGTAVNATGSYGWPASGGAANAKDTTLCREAAGKVEVASAATCTNTGSVDATTYFAAGTTGVSAGSFSAITAITTSGGIVTQLTGSSDERLKYGVNYTNGLEAILKIHPKRYHWNEKGQKQTGLPGSFEYVGFFAQDVQKAIPEAITGSEPSRTPGETTRYLDFDDRPVVAALVSAVQEQQKEIEQLKKRMR